MGQLEQILSFPGLTLAGIAESFLAIKLFPEYYSSQSHLSAVGFILLANYGFGLFFWLLIYPNFLSPLRNLPGPRVSRRTIHPVDEQLVLTIFPSLYSAPPIKPSLSRTDLLVNSG